MSDHAGVQLLIENLVEGYKQLFPGEYQAFLGMQRKKASSRDRSNKLLKITSTDVLERKLGEYPATLHTILYSRMTPEQFTYFDSKEGTVWFFTKFPEFRETAKI